MALCGNFSSQVSATDPVKVSKDALKKKYLVGGCGFFVSDS